MRPRRARPETPGAAADADHCFRSAPSLHACSDRARSGRWSNALIRSRQRTERCSCAAAAFRSCGSCRCRVLPISMNRPNGRRIERLLSIASPASEFSTRSTPSPSVNAQHLVGEGETARIHHMRHAERGEQFPLLGRAGGGKDDGPCLQRQLHGRQSDAAGGRMDQHPFSTLQLRRACGANRSAVKKAMGIVAACSKLRWRGLGAREPRIAGDVGRQAAVPAGHDLVADGKFRDLVADGDHAAGALQAEQVAERGSSTSPPWEAFPCQHQVHEVEAGGRDLDLDLVGFGRPCARHRGAPTASPEFPAAAIRCGTAADAAAVASAQSVHRGRGYRHQAVHVSQLAVQGDLILRYRPARQFLGERLDLLAGAGRQIDQPAAQVLIFVDRDPAEPPERRLRHLESCRRGRSIGCAERVTSQMPSTARPSVAASA